MNLLGSSIIGASRGVRGERLAFSQDPRSGERFGPGYSDASELELQRACALAGEAAPVFAALDPARRAEFLNRIADGLAAHEADFLNVTPRETGLPDARIKGELARTCGQLRAFAQLVAEGSWLDARIDHADAQRVPPKPELRSQLEALGPVAVFCASNFPLAFSVAGGDTASALAAGCPVVVKAHSQHPMTAEIAGTVIAQCVRDAGLPEGVFSLIYGPGSTLGLALVRHPQIRAVGFTGSLSGGRALMDAAAARPQPIPVFAEMGSLNPVFIFPAALAKKAEAIAVALHQSITNGVGQFCTCPGVLLALKTPGNDRFVDRLSALLGDTPAAPMLSINGAERFRHSVASVRAQGGVSARVQGASAGGLSTPVLLEVDCATLAANPAVREEMFGPAALLSLADDLQAMLQVAEQLDGQLTATVWAEPEDYPLLEQLLPILRRKAGRVLFNGVPTGVEVVPSQVHGGPYPASSDARFTAVGTAAIFRFARPVCYQNWPAELLPPSLQDSNPLRLWRTVDGRRVAPETDVL